MRTFTQARTARACAFAGALGIGFTLTFAAQPALGADKHPVAAGAPWLSAVLGLGREVFGSPRHFGSRRGAQDATAGKLRLMTRAGDRIAKLPYLWGGGHGSFTAS